MELTRRNPARALQTLMFEALKREDETLNHLAMDAIAVIGKDAVHTLVTEILSSSKVKYRVRVLRRVNCYYPLFR